MVRFSANRVSAISFLLLAGIYVSSTSSGIEFSIPLLFWQVTTWNKFSALGCMYGTPRILQSISNENVIPGIHLLGNGKHVFKGGFKKWILKSFKKEEDQTKFHWTQC